MEFKYKLSSKRKVAVLQHMENQPNITKETKKNKTNIQNANVWTLTLVENMLD